MDTDGVTSSVGPPSSVGPTDADALLWDLVIPVKRLARAKSRLEGLSDGRRRRLALAFALDAAGAALASARVRRVLVVTADPEAAAALRRRGAALVEETGSAGLNAAIAEGVAAARRADRLRRIAVMTGDLPAVSSAEIDAALASAALHRRAVLADAESTGTVLLTANPLVDPEAPSPVPLRPLFGAGSCARHVVAGHIALAGDHPGLRRDVDTREDLEAARALGLGPATAAVLKDVGAPLLAG